MRLGKASRAVPALSALPGASSKTDVSSQPTEKWVLLRFAEGGLHCCGVQGAFQGRHKQGRDTGKGQGLLEPGGGLRQTLHRPRALPGLWVGVKVGILKWPLKSIESPL